MDESGNIYVLKATFGGAFFDHVQLESFTAEGKPRWTFNKNLPDMQASYWLQIVKDMIYIQSSSCCAPDGSYKGHIVKLSLDGAAAWSRDMVGTSVVGRDGTIYGLATPSTAKGPVSYLYAMDDSGKTLWNFTDGASQVKYLQLGTEEICMPVSAGQVGSVLCVDMKGKQVLNQKVTDSYYMQFDLIGNGGNFYVRRTRDNSYYHNGTNVLFPLFKKTASDHWSFAFPDDVDMVGTISRAKNGALVVLTRPDCQCRPDSLIAVGPDGKMHWNATLPGAGDVSVNPAYPPLFGPYGANDLVFTSTIKTLHGDNKTNDMWYSAIKDGKVAWKETISGVTDKTAMTYSANAAGDFFIIKDGVLWKFAAAAQATARKAVYV